MRHGPDSGEHGMSRPGAHGGCRDVVVSGLGVVSPYGAGVTRFWSGLAAGTCTIKPITLIETAAFARASPPDPRLPS